MAQTPEAETAIQWKLRAAAAARDPDVPPEEVLVLYRRALDLDPGLVGAWAGLGTTLAVMGNYDEALQALGRGLEIDPGNEDCLARRTRVLEWMNARAVREEVPEDLVESADSCLARALSLDARGQPAEAIAWLHKALAIAPRHRHAREALAVTLLKLGRWADALAQYDTLLAGSALAGKRLAHAQWGKGICLRELGRPRDALPWLDKAGQTMPGNGDLARDRAATVEAIRRRAGSG